MSFRGQAVLSALALVLAALPAQAKVVDNEMPQITPDVVKPPPAGKPVSIECDIVDASGVFDPVVNWRVLNTPNYTRAALKPTKGTRFHADIQLPPGVLVFEYFIEAYDENGNGPARVGSAQTPLKIDLSPPKPVVVKKAPPPEAPLSPKIPAYIALGVGGVGLIAGAVFGLSASGAHDNWLKTYDPVKRPEYAASVKSNALLADVSFGVGIAAAAVGAVLLVRAPKSAPSAAPAEDGAEDAGNTISVLPTPAGLLIRAEF